MICGYRIEFDADQDLLLAYVARHTNKLGGSEKRKKSRVEQSPKEQGTPALYAVDLATTVADDNPQQSGIRVVVANDGSGLHSGQPQHKLELPLWVERGQSIECKVAEKKGKTCDNPPRARRPAMIRGPLAVPGASECERNYYFFRDLSHIPKLSKGLSAAAALPDFLSTTI